jgi:hypothetical protein
MPAGVPSWQITLRVTRASIEIVKFKRLSVDFPLTAPKDWFACADKVRVSTVVITFDPSAGCRRKLAQASNMFMFPMMRLIHWMSAFRVSTQWWLQNEGVLPDLELLSRNGRRMHNGVQPAPRAAPKLYRVRRKRTNRQRWNLGYRAGPVRYTLIRTRSPFISTLSCQPRKSSQTMTGSQFELSFNFSSTQPNLEIS